VDPNTEKVSSDPEHCKSYCSIDQTDTDTGIYLPYTIPVIYLYSFLIQEAAGGDHGGGESEYESADEDIVRSPKPTAADTNEFSDDEEEHDEHEHEDDEDAEDEEEEEDYDEEELDELGGGGGKQGGGEATAAAVRPSMERERGDGEESVDDDKDKKNPQAIFGKERK
jgi:hypothetical protein